MAVTIREATIEDADGAAVVCAAAFSKLGEELGVTLRLGVPAVAAKIVGSKLATCGVDAVVAEDDGQIIGVNFVDHRLAVAGVGPICVMPGTQANGIGKRLMEESLSRADQMGFPDSTLATAAGNHTTLVLYSKMGFVYRDLAVAFNGPRIFHDSPGRTVREASSVDLDDCERICIAVHGYSKMAELGDGIRNGSALVVERDGVVSGYSTGVNFQGHSVAIDTEDLMALIAATNVFGQPGFLVPASNSELISWCLNMGLRVGHQVILMSRGRYTAPQGPYLPHV